MQTMWQGKEVSPLWGKQIYRKGEVVLCEFKLDIFEGEEEMNCSQCGQSYGSEDRENHWIREAELADKELKGAMFLISDAELLLENLPPINGYQNWKDNVKSLLKRMSEWKEKR